MLLVCSSPSTAGALPCPPPPPLQEPLLHATGIFVSAGRHGGAADAPAGPAREQHGVLRTNCIDSLDRWAARGGWGRLCLCLRGGRLVTTGGHTGGRLLARQHRLACGAGACSSGAHPAPPSAASTLSAGPMWRSLHTACWPWGSSCTRWASRVRGALRYTPRCPARAEHAAPAACSTDGVSSPRLGCSLPALPA